MTPLPLLNHTGETFCLLVMGLSCYHGWGYGVLSVLAGPKGAAQHAWPSRVFWGMAACATLACGVNFFIPLSDYFCAGVVIAGSAISLLRLSRWYRSSAQLREALLFAAVALIFSHFLNAPGTPDRGAYHVGAIIWLHHEATPLGLANLHHRLAFNSLFYPAAAVLWVPVAGLRAAFACVPILTLTFLFYLKSASHCSARVGQKTILVGMAIMTFIAGRKFLLMSLGEPGTDTPANLWVLAATAAFVASDSENSRARAYVRDLWMLALLAPLFKLSAAPAAILPALWLQHARRQQLSVWPGVGIVCFLAAAAGLYTLRSVFLSGCLAFPAALTCLPALPWFTGWDEVHSAAAWITSWARGELSPAEAMGNYRWLLPWLRSLAVSEYMLMTFCLFAGIGAGSFLARRPAALLAADCDADRHQRRQLLLTALGGIIFWFLYAPALRFSFAFWIIAAAVAAARFGLVRLVAWQLTKPGRQFLLLLAIVALCPQLNVGHRWRLRDSSRPAYAVSAISSECPVTQPVGDGGCWDASLPCTPYPRPDLRCRKTTRWIFYPTAGTQL